MKRFFGVFVLWGLLLAGGAFSAQAAPIFELEPGVERPEELFVLSDRSVVLQRSMTEWGNVQTQLTKYTDGQAVAERTVSMQQLFVTKFGGKSYFVVQLQTNEIVILNERLRDYAKVPFEGKAQPYQLAVDGQHLLLHDNGETKVFDLAKRAFVTDYSFVATSGFVLRDVDTQGYIVYVLDQFGFVMDQVTLKEAPFAWDDLVLSAYVYEDRLAFYVDFSLNGQKGWYVYDLTGELLHEATQDFVALGTPIVVGSKLVYLTLGEDGASFVSEFDLQTFELTRRYDSSAHMLQRIDDEMYLEAYYGGVHKLRSAVHEGLFEHEALLEEELLAKTDYFLVQQSDFVSFYDKRTLAEIARLELDDVLQVRNLGDGYLYVETATAGAVYKWSSEPVVKVVAPDKEWTVRFTQPIDPTSVTNHNVYVLDAAGKRVEVTLEVMNNELLVKPRVQYAAGTYTLHIGNVQSLKDQRVQRRTVAMRFIVQ